MLSRHGKKPHSVVFLMAASMNEKGGPSHDLQHLHMTCEISNTVGSK